MCITLHTYIPAFAQTQSVKSCLDYMLIQDILCVVENIQCKHLCITNSTLNWTFCIMKKKRCREVLVKKIFGFCSIFKNWGSGSSSSFVTLNCSDSDSWKKSSNYLNCVAGRRQRRRCQRRWRRRQRQFYQQERWFTLERIWNAHKRRHHLSNNYTLTFIYVEKTKTN